MSEAVKDLIYRQVLETEVEDRNYNDALAGYNTTGGRYDAITMKYAPVQCWYCGCWDSKGYVTCPRCNGPRRQGHG